jgi:hypothetical protein
VHFLEEKLGRDSVHCLVEKKKTSWGLYVYFLVQKLGRDSAHFPVEKLDRDSVFFLVFL